MIFSIIAPTDLAYDRLIEFLKMVLLLIPNEELCLNMETAIREVIGNAIEHGNRHNPNLTVKMTLIIENSHIECIVTNEGDGWDVPQFIDKFHADDGLKSLAQSTALHGRGLLMAILCSDGLTWRNRGRSCRIFWRRS